MNPERKIVMAEYRGIPCAFCLENGILVEAVPDESGGDCFAVGDIVLGRVQDVQPVLNAAFVRIAPSMKEQERQGGAGYLPFSELPPEYRAKADGSGRATGKSSKTLLKPQMEIPVQIQSLPSGSKPYRLTALPVLDGKYCAVGQGIRGITASKKLDAGAKKQLLDAVRQQTAAGSDGGTADGKENFGVIIRTNARELLEEGGTDSLQPLLCEIAELSARLHDIYTVSDMRKTGTVLYRQLSPVERRIRDFEPSEIIRDTDKDYLAVHGIEKQIGEAFLRKVWLKSGAYLVLDRTEALNVIDVNSGRREVGRRTAKEPDAAETAAFQVNAEAAAEALHQIRLRGLSGMILIDFINMNSEHTEKLADILRALCAKDPVPTSFVDFTELGIAELTRKKTGPPLEELLRQSSGPDGGSGSADAGKNDLL
jgi:ribonuclease G